MVRLRCAAIVPLAAMCALALGSSGLILPTSEILKNLKSNDSAVRFKAANDILMLDPDQNVQWFDKICSALTGALEDKDASVGDAASLGFARIRTGSYPPDDRLYLMLDSPRPEVVRRAMTALWISESQAFGHGRAFRVLGDSKSTSPQRLVALNDLNTDGGYTGFEQTMILNGCKDANPEVRMKALRLLGKSQCSEAREWFLELSHDANPQVRLAAVQAMYDTCDDTLNQAIKAARMDKNPKIAALAKKLCRRLPTSALHGDTFNGKPPRFYDSKLGPYSLSHMGSLSMMNPRRTRFFVKGGECDGADSWIAISSEPGSKQIPDAICDMVECSVPDYKTGKGIGLGDTRESVQKKLGKPTRVKNKNGRTIDVYRAGGEDNYYEATYRYAEGRLVGICLGKYSDEG